MKLGLVCMLTNTKFKKGFSGLSALKNADNIEDKLLDATIHNIAETKKCIQWVIDNKTGMYRFSSELIPFYEFWKWDSYPQIVNGLLELGRMIKLNNIRGIIHPDQFCVINSENDNVVNNSIKILEHHFVLSQYLNIDDIIIHTGSAKGDYIDRFVNNFKRLHKSIKSKICVENCHSVNIDTVLEISKLTGAKPLLDFHHDRIKPCDNLENSIINILNMWKSKPLAHISSGKTADNDKAHADYISKNDVLIWNKYLKYFDTEVEAKLKEKSIKNMLTYL